MAKAIPFRGEATVKIGDDEVTLRLSIAEIEQLEARDERGIVGLVVSLTNMATAKLTDAIFVIGLGMIGAGDKNGMEKARALASNASINELVIAACALLTAQLKTGQDAPAGNAPEATVTAA